MYFSWGTCVLWVSRYFIGHTDVSACLVHVYYIFRQVKGICTILLGVGVNFKVIEGHAHVLFLGKSDVYFA